MDVIIIQNRKHQYRNTFWLLFLVKTESVIEIGFLIKIRLPTEQDISYVSDFNSKSLMCKASQNNSNSKNNYDN